jgi:hypothetical protein
VTRPPYADPGCARPRTRADRVALCLVAEPGGLLPRRPERVACCLSGRTGWPIAPLAEPAGLLWRIKQR